MAKKGTIDLQMNAISQGAVVMCCAPRGAIDVLICMSAESNNVDKQNYRLELKSRFVFRDCL